MRVFVAGGTGVIGQHRSWRDGFPVWAAAFKSGQAA